MTECALNLPRFCQWSVVYEWITHQYRNLLEHDDTKEAEKGGKDVGTHRLNTTACHKLQSMFTEKMKFKRLIYTCNESLSECPQYVRATTSGPSLQPATR